MIRRSFMAALLAVPFVASAQAQQTVKIGLIVPMTGQSQSTGKQIDAAVRLYLQQHGDTVAGKKIEVVLRDDGGVADTTKRVAQELIVRDKVSVLAGFGLTPLAMATAPLAAQAKVPMVVMAAATSIITAQNPFIVRTSQVLPQPAAAMAQWAVENGIKSAVTLVTDYGPGIDAETWFAKRMKEGGAEVLASLRMPLASPDFAPFLQRAADARPQAMFVFVPSGQGAALVEAMKGLSWESPRGPMMIDPQTRDVVHNLYIRKVERVDSELYNVEFATIPMMKDPAKP